MLRQSVAGNSPFRGIVFCNLGTSKTVISNFVTTANIATPYLSRWLPQRCSRWTKKRLAHKKVEVTNVLIPWYPISYLTIASSVFLGGALTGPYPTLRFGGACGRGVGAFYSGLNDFSEYRSPGT
jgi:hypothetical protein